MDTACLSDFSALSISPEALAARLAGPRAPLLLDVRRDAAWHGSEWQLAGALRCAPEQVAHWAAQHPPREVVVYCVYGHGVGRDAALALRQAGWDAQFLAGGLQGGEDGVDSPADIERWRSAALPREPRAAPAGPGLAP